MRAALFTTLFLLAAPTAAHAAFTASIADGVVTFTGDGTADTLVVTVGPNGAVSHNRAGDPGFASAGDFDSSAAGEQARTDTPRLQVDVAGDVAGDVVRLQATGPEDGQWRQAGSVPEGPTTCTTRVPGTATDTSRGVTLCHPSGLARAELGGGDGGDSVMLLDSRGGVPLLMDGGGGNDDFFGGTPAQSGLAGQFHQLRSEVTFSGGPGSDSAQFGGLGDDGMMSVDVAPGAFILRSNSEAITPYPQVHFDDTTESAWVYGRNGGTDITVLPGVTQSLTLWGGRAFDTIDASRARSDVYARGFEGADTLIGGPENDLIVGDEGDDTILGGAGIDNLDGGAGSDNINARDGEADQVDCKEGPDSVTADRSDRVSNCERRGAPVTLRVGALNARRVILFTSSSGSLRMTVRRGRRVVGTRRFNIRAGAVEVLWNGRVRGRRLSAGRYRVTLRLVARIGRSPSVSRPLSVRR